MDSGDVLLSELVREGERRGQVSPERWLFDPPPAQAQLQVESVSMELRFSDVPQAAVVAGLLEKVDREARRVATGLERRISPEVLRGRGVRLIPPRQGLAVEQGRPGSLTLDLLLGGLYTIVTSQPLSFALNLSALLGYGRVLVRAVLPGGNSKSTEISVSSAGSSVTGAWKSPKPPLVLSTPHGPALIPDGFEYVKIEMKGADGTEVSLECRPDRGGPLPPKEG